MNLSSMNPLTHSMPSISVGTNGRSSSALTDKGSMQGRVSTGNLRDGPIPTRVPSAHNDVTSGASSVRSQNSFGSFSHEDDELKSILVRAVHGMKVRWFVDAVQQHSASSHSGKGCVVATT